MSSRRATIADVAREAGVSASTASVVFSGKVVVSDATRAKVIAAAESLGYTGPDPRAASLRTGRAGIVAVQPVAAPPATAHRRQARHEATAVSAAPQAPQRTGQRPPRARAGTTSHQVPESNRKHNFPTGYG